MLNVTGEADIALALAPRVLFSRIYSLCVCQERWGSTQRVGCGLSENIGRAGSIGTLGTHLPTQTRKSESAFGTLTERHRPHENCQLSNSLPGKGLVRLWKAVAIIHPYQAIFI